MSKNTNFIKSESVKTKMLEYHSHHCFETSDTALFHDYYFSRILFKGRLLCNKATKVYYL